MRVDLLDPQHPHWRLPDDVGCLLLGLLEPSETRVLLDHADECGHCWELVDSLRPTVGRLLEMTALMTPCPPPPVLRSRVLGAVRDGRRDLSSG